MLKTWRRYIRKSRTRIDAAFWNSSGRCWGDCTIVDFSDRPASKTSSTQAPPAVTQKLTLIDRETRNPYPRTSGRKDIIERLLLNVRRQIQAEERFSEQQWSGFCENYCSSLSVEHNITSAQLLPQIIALASRKERNRAENI
jgi:hypothetical protein